MIFEQLENPAALWLIVPAVLLFVICLLRKKGDFVSLFLRTLTFSLLALALAQPFRSQSKETAELAALIDVSESISARGEQAFLSLLSRYQKDGLTLQLFPFAKTMGKTPLLISGQTTPEEIKRQLQTLKPDLDRGQTDIGAALKGFMARIESSSVLLLSDGFETTGASEEIARTADLRIFPLVPDEEAFLNSGVSLSSVHAPNVSGAGDIVEIRTSTMNHQGQTSSAKASDNSGRLEIFLDKEKLYSNSLTVPANEEKLITAKTSPLQGGLHRVRAILLDNQQNILSEMHRWISVKEKSKLLLLSGNQDDRRILSKLLGLKGYAVEDIVADGLTKIPVEFKNYSGIIVNNVAKRQLPAEFLPQLEGYVERGGGLLLIGGERSFGLGGYIDSPLEKLSPLKFVPPQTTKRRLNTAVALVIDKSRSMIHEGKIEAAKFAALRAIKAMKDEDYIAVIGFDSAPFVIIRLSRVSEVRPIAEHRLENLTAAGRTNLLPAMVQARRSLADAEAGRKHIIILSDGKLPISGNDYVDEISRMRSAGITVSGVALGMDADVPFMKLLAKYGKGAFYHTLDPSNLPEVFMHDIKVTTGEKTMKESESFPVHAGNDGIVSTLVTEFPTIKGFVETLPKQGANLELVTEGDEKLSPVLASWHYGQGKVIAFTSDANGRWSERWLQWHDFSQFWGDLIEGIKGKTQVQGEVDFDLRYFVNHGDITLDLAVFDPALETGSAPQIAVDVIEPGGELKRTVFQEHAKGRFFATIHHGRPGDYRIEVTYGKTKFPPLALTLPASAFGEQKGQGLNLPNLSQLATLTEGTINPAPEELSAPTRINTQKEPLHWPFLLAAFALILLEAFIRELGFPRWRFGKQAPITELQTTIYQTQSKRFQTKRKRA